MTSRSQKQQQKIDAVRIDSIEMLPGRRCPDAAAVAVLAASIERLGLRSPIWVRYHPNRPGSDGTDDSIVLIAGAHRLAAAKSLGWEKIDAVFLTDELVDDELLEIAENLHRAELTALERSNQIARWAELTAEKVLQVATPLGGQQPQEKGVRKMARDLGLSPADVSRAVKVASMSPAAKDAARAAGLDDNRTALLQASRETTSRGQVSVIRKIAKSRSKPRATTTPSPGRGRDAICDRVREALRVLAGLPPAHEVGQYFAGTDAAMLVAETVGPARAWLNEFADGWTSAEQEESSAHQALQSSPPTRSVQR